MQEKLRDMVWPAGLLGPMVKPPEWKHRWHEVRSFERDWNALMAAWKRWKSPIRELQRRAWEKEKDELRKWWFSLSRRERHYWLGRRDEGQFPNILAEARRFKGPKYQRGTIQMSAFGVAPIMTPGVSLSLDSANNNAINIDFSPPGPLEASFYCQTNGELYRVSSSGTTHDNDGDWITSNPTASVGDDYEVKWNYLSGSLTRLTGGSTNYSEDTWSRLNLERRVGQDTSASSTPSTFELDIGDYLASSSDVNQDYTVEAGNLI